MNFKLLLVYFPFAFTLLHAHNSIGIPDCAGQAVGFSIHYEMHAIPSSTE